MTQLSINIKINCRFLMRNPVDKISILTCIPTHLPSIIKVFAIFQNGDVIDMRYVRKKGKFFLINASLCSETFIELSLAKK